MDDPRSGWDMLPPKMRNTARRAYAIASTHSFAQRDGLVYRVASRSPNHMEIRSGGSFRSVRAGSIADRGGLDRGGARRRGRFALRQLRATARRGGAHRHRRVQLRSFPSSSCVPPGKEGGGPDRDRTDAAHRVRGWQGERRAPSGTPARPLSARRSPARLGRRPDGRARPSGCAPFARRAQGNPPPYSARGEIVTFRERNPMRRLSRIEGERRALRATGASSRETALQRDIAVHDAIRILGLEPATLPKSGYDARGSRIRYRIAGSTPADSLLTAGAFRLGQWDRGLLVSMTAEMDPLAIDELTIEAALASRSVSALRAAGRPLWRRE